MIRKRLFLNFLSLLFSFFLLESTGMAVLTTKKVELEEVKDYAIKNNFKIQSLKNKLLAGQKKTSRLWSSFYPKIGIATGLQNEHAKTSDETTSLGYVYGNINLFNGLRDSHAIGLSELETKKSEIDLNQAKFRIGQEVEQKFYMFLFKMDLINLKNRALELNRNHRQLVNRTRMYGAGSKTDEMEFELKESLLKSEIVTLEKDLEEVRIHLKKLLGQEIGHQIEPIGHLPHQHVVGDLNQYLKQVHATNANILQASKDLSMAEIESKKHRSGWLPRIDVETKVGYLDTDENKLKDEPEATFLVSMKLDLFSGMETYWEKIEGERLRLHSSYELKEQILATMTEVEIFYRRLKSIENRVDLEKGNERLSKNYYESVLSEYKRGFKNSMDLSSASDKMFDSIEKNITFKHEFLQEKIQLQLNLGLLVNVETFSEGSPH